MTPMDRRRLRGSGTQRALLPERHRDCRFGPGRRCRRMHRMRGAHEGRRPDPRAQVCSAAGTACVYSMGLAVEQVAAAGGRRRRHNGNDRAATRRWTEPTSTTRPPLPREPMSPPRPASSAMRSARRWASNTRPGWTTARTSWSSAAPASPISPSRDQQYRAGSADLPRRGVGRRPSPGAVIPAPAGLAPACRQRRSRVRG